MSQAVLRLAAGAVLGAVLVLGSGCAENESSLFIRQVNVAAEGSTCVVTPDPSSLFLPHGYLDAAFRSQYHAALLVGSQLTARGSRQQLRTETSRIQLEGTEVMVTDDQSNTQVMQATTVPGSGFIDPANGADPSYGILDSILLAVSGAFSAQVATAGRTSSINVTSHVRAFGHTLGGTYIESGEWLYPISICYGCLVTYPADAIGTTATGAPACNAPTGTGTSIVTPCNPGQDDPVDCRVCQEYLGPGAPVCEPP